MSFVYLARHRLLQQEVAVKVLKQEYARMVNMKGRFLAEARSLFRMSHTNILRVTDMIDEGETVAFVMEYVEGWSLRNYLERKGMLREEEISQILVQMLNALDYVHSQGLVHRDIKPSNIMLTPGGVVKLMDFGISKRTEGAMEYTATGLQQILGTPMYMSPEQIKSTKDVTYVSDLYSLGVVLWEMVTGRKPYNGETESTYQIQTRIVREELPLTGTLWDVIICRSTVKDEGERYRSAKEFRTAVEKAFGYKDKTIIADHTIMEVTTEATVKIGNQEWMTRNLDVDRFRNGELIPHVESAEEWEKAGENKEPAWCYYDNDPAKGKIYGKLYNWYAVNDPRGLAPEGWHVPTDEEWTNLTDYLGGEEVAGGKMKSKGTTYWHSQNRGVTNESGFSALPGGFRSSAGSFYDISGSAFFWSAAEYANYYAWFRLLGSSDGSVSRGCNLLKSVGASVRCLRD